MKSIYDRKVCRNGNKGSLSVSEERKYDVVYAGAINENFSLEDVIKYICVEVQTFR